MSITTAGFSEEARYVSEYRQREESRFRDSETFGVDSKLREELADVWGECQHKNWDGYNAIPVARETLSNVYQLLEMLPLGLPSPSLAAEPDGQVTLEWYRSPRRLLSVSISPMNELHYAALLGPNRVYGTEIVLGQWPATIMELVKKVLGR